MQAIEYRNCFGLALVSPVTNAMPIRALTSRCSLAQSNLIDIETAERLALISENRGIQIVPEFPLTGRAFVVLHDSPSTGAICAVQIERFASQTAASKTLDRVNRLASY